MTPFLFGKLPAHGDFVSRGVAPDERAALDDWLSASLADGRAATPDGFDDAYERAPPWRAAWREGDGWAAGALAASVDAVGRRFPILLGARDLAGDVVEGTADALEGLLYAALAEGLDADALLAAAAGIAATPNAGQPSERWWTVDADGTTAAELAGARPAGLIAAMLLMGRELA